MQRPPEGDTSFAAMATDFEIHATKRTKRRAASHPESLVELDREVKSLSDREPRAPARVHLETQRDLHDKSLPNDFGSVLTPYFSHDQATACKTQYTFYQVMNANSHAKLYQRPLWSKSVWKLR